MPKFDAAQVAEYITECQTATKSPFFASPGRMAKLVCTHAGFPSWEAEAAWDYSNARRECESNRSIPGDCPLTCYNCPVSWDLERLSTALIDHDYEYLYK